MSTIPVLTADQCADRWVLTDDTATPDAVVEDDGCLDGNRCTGCQCCWTRGTLAAGRDDC